MHFDTLKEHSHIARREFPKIQLNLHPTNGLLNVHAELIVRHCEGESELRSTLRMRNCLRSSRKLFSAEKTS
jgi:hypothetical protein